MDIIEFKVQYIKNQIKLCKDGIENGNWNGYSENLAIRKQKLKELEEELKQLEIENL